MVASTRPNSLPDLDECLERCVQTLQSWELDARRGVVQSEEKPYFSNGVFANDLRDMGELLVRLQGERAEAALNGLAPLTPEDDELLHALQAEAPATETVAGLIARTNRERAMAAALIRRLMPSASGLASASSVEPNDANPSMTPAMREVMNEYQRKTGQVFPFLDKPLVFNLDAAGMTDAPDHSKETS